MAWRRRNLQLLGQEEAMTFVLTRILCCKKQKLTWTSLLIIEAGESGSEIRPHPA